MQPVDRDSPLWRECWQGLTKAGHEVSDYMLMYYNPTTMRAAFRHSLTRAYVHVIPTQDRG